MNNFKFNTATNRWEYFIDGKVAKIFTDRQMHEFNYRPPIDIGMDPPPEGTDSSKTKSNDNENDSHLRKAETGSSDNKDDPDPFWQALRVQWSDEHGPDIGSLAVRVKR